MVAGRTEKRKERRRPSSQQQTGTEVTAPKPGASTAVAQAAPRRARQAERRDAILSAALEEFAVSGFAATRLDDVARRAGVAKGTIYLYFRDKEALFQELVRSMLSPVIGTITAVPMADVPVRKVVEMIAELFAQEIFGTRRKDIIRLIITEGARFPKLAEFYYHEVIERVMAAMRPLLVRAVERGELRSDALARFPQLLVAPALVAIVWNGMFDRIAPLDVRELMRAHIELIFGERAAS